MGTEFFFSPQGYSCGVVKLPAPSANFKNELSYASAPPLRLHVVDGEKVYL